MTTDQSKVVWILGAGFSKPLGGPLLDELFQDDFHFQVTDVLGDTWKRGLDSVIGLYGEVALGETVRKPRRGTWTNAEEFLAVLSDALPGDDTIQRRLARGKVGRALKRGATDQDVRAAFDAAIKYMHAVCSYFVPGSDRPREAIGPRHLGPAFDSFASFVRSTRSTMISFNYDCAVERLFHDQVATVLPDDVRLHASANQGLPWLFKLHGSVDWSVAIDRGGYQIVDVPWIGRPGASVRGPCLGLPGRPKAELAENVLAPLWREAAERLREADIVVLCGYSLPATDADVSAWLVEQLRENRSRHLSVWTLMPRPASDDVVRTIHTNIREGLAHRKGDFTEKRELMALEKPGFVVHHMNERCESFFARLRSDTRLSAWPPSTLV